jgi:hypothetical protein
MQAGRPSVTARRVAAQRLGFTRVSALEAGIDQVVVVGAGYDGRALRYSRPGVRWFEVDHPDTQADKRERRLLVGLRTLSSSGTRLAVSVSVEVTDGDAVALARRNHFARRVAAVGEPGGGSRRRGPGRELVIPKEPGRYPDPARAGSQRYLAAQCP